MAILGYGQRTDVPPSRGDAHRSGPAPEHCDDRRDPHQSSDGSPSRIDSHVWLLLALERVGESGRHRHRGATIRRCGTQVEIEAECVAYARSTRNCRTPIRSC